MGIAPSHISSGEHHTSRNVTATTSNLVDPSSSLTGSPRHGDEATSGARLLHQKMLDHFKSIPEIHRSPLPPPSLILECTEDEEHSRGRAPLNRDESLKEGFEKNAEMTDKENVTASQTQMDEGKSTSYIGQRKRAFAMHSAQKRSPETHASRSADLPGTGSPRQGSATATKSLYSDNRTLREEETTTAEKHDANGQDVPLDLQHTDEVTKETKPTENSASKEKKKKNRILIGGVRRVTPPKHTKPSIDGV